MYLKRLEIFGFKSFADKVEIEFRPGITAIVGPNGCGKSNIVDALRWVLGEQSLKSLRGAKMDDVIFAGTEKRKPLGLAQVELVLDNSDGSLPLDFAEVAVARRLYRSGESEVFLNKSSVRLRDIQELFLDTGLGKEAYSVIGQGKIDAILSVKAEERRAVFEEAAGVVKYKLRKAAALRRLEETEANRTRVLDLLAALEEELGPLQAQALLAQEYRRLEAELVELDLNMTGREVLALQKAIAIDEEALATLRSRDEELGREEALLEAELEKIRLENMKREEELARLRQNVFALSGRLEQERSKLLVGQEKERALLARQGELQVEREKLTTRREELLARRTAQAASLAAVEEARAQIAAALASSEGAVAGREEFLRTLLAREEALKAEIIEDMNRVAAARNRLQAACMEEEYLSRRHEETVAKARTCAETLARVTDSLAAAEAQVAGMKEAEKELVRLQEELGGRRRMMQARLAELEAENQRRREEGKALESRLAVLEEMEKNYQGYFPGVRSLLVEAKGEPFARGIRGLVAELIKVEPGYELAMEVALGSALQYVVIEDDAQAQAAIAFLKRSGRGRATFLPLNMVRGTRATAAGLAAALQAHGARFAADLLTYAPEYRGVVDYLLGNTLVAPDLATAVALAKREGKGFRLVTREGEVISVGGAITGGPLDRRQPQLLGRKKEIEDLRRRQEEVEASLAAGRAMVARLREEMAGLEAEQEAARSRREEIAGALAAASRTLESCRAERTRWEEELALARLKLQEDEEEGKRLVGQKEEAASALAAAEEILARHREELAGLEEELRRRREEKDQALQALSDHRVELAAKSEEEKRHREALEETERLLGEAEEELARCQAAVDEIEAALARRRAEEARLTETIAELEKAGAEAAAAVEELSAAKEEAGDDQRKRETRLRALRRERQALAEQIHRRELSLGEARIRVEDRLAHLEREYGPDWAEKLAPAWEMAPEEAARQVETLRLQMRNLGPVNLGAIAEYEAKKARYDFLRRQSDDLAEAKDSLEKIIAEVERTISRRFLETFAAVREAFGRLFRRLFAGGQADLVLLDPEAPLEAGIEILAQPPGKRLQSLSLLSGGERAMTAIALLFAILEVKPTPFCILDEIDATLDEANVARFAELLRAFGQQTQLIVITHRRGTMEVADALYGVTMEESGVSKLVSLALKEKAG
ncbi:MAG: chromosome segregation protein SMC [Firmicutes bacterium]|nr:chromosome segregation protein SMC [Bacillota bacterium]